MMSSLPLGSGGCASAHGTACRCVLSGAWRSPTSAWLHTFGPAQSPGEVVCVLCVNVEGGGEKGGRRALKRKRSKRQWRGMWKEEGRSNNREEREK